jgi:hypothetical protein
MLTRVSDHLSRRPNGWAAVAIAAAVAVSTATLGLTREQPVWVADTLPVVPTVVQMHRHGTRDLSAYLVPPRQGRWSMWSPEGTDPYCLRPGPDGTGRYSSYPAGMEVFAWPAVLIAGAKGWPIEQDWCQVNLERQTAAVVGGLCVGLFFLAALHVGRPAAAFVTTLLLATGSVVPSTLTQLLWQQTGVVFFILVVLLVELRSRGQPGRSGLFVQALACSLMLVCRPSAVTFLVPFGIWVLVRDRRRGFLLPVLAGVAYLPWAAMYYTLYRTPFGPSMTFLDEHPWALLANAHAVLFCPGRGLFVYQPWTWLTFLLLSRSVRTDPDRRLPAGWYAFCVAFAACHVALVGSWAYWWGGYCWGSRLVAEVVPVAGLLAVRPVGWLLKRWWGCGVLAAVAAVGIYLHAVYLYLGAGWWDALVAVDQNPHRLWDWRNPPFLHRDP